MKKSLEALNSYLFIYPKYRILLILLVSNLAIQTACQKKEESSAVEAIVSRSTAPPPERYLYIASGACYSGGGNTTFTGTTASNLIYRISLTTGAKDSLIADYNAIPANTSDTPVALAKATDSNYLNVLVENATGRRLEKIPKSFQGTRTLITSNATIFSAALRALSSFSDGTFWVSKSTAIEKLNSIGQRITVGAGAAFVNAPGGTCATSTTLITSLTSLTNGKLVFTHAAAAQNRFAIISATGYVAATDCLASQSAPNASSFPTASAYVTSDNHLLVAYAGNTVATDINSIYSYSINESTNAITAPTKLIDGFVSNYIYGISAMAYDNETKSLFVATANGVTPAIANYNIEKFTYDPAAKTLTRVGMSPFYTYGFDTRCISSMMVE